MPELSIPITLPKLDPRAHPVGLQEVADNPQCKLQGAAKDWGVISICTLFHRGCYVVNAAYTVRPR